MSVQTVREHHIHARTTQAARLPPGRISSRCCEEDCVCDFTSIDCCHRECPVCKDNVVVYHEFYQDYSAERTDAEGQSQTDKWSWQWTTVTEEVNGKSIDKTVRKNISGSVSTLKEAYNKNIQAMYPPLQHQPSMSSLQGEKRATPR